MELNYKSFGSGPALIILHGLFGSLDNWQTLARQFGEHFSVFILDQRNHGKSPHSVETFTYPLLAEDLYEFMDSHAIYEAHLLGHSMGGKTVMQFAAAHEDMIDKLVVADMGIRQNERHHDIVLETLATIPFAEIHSRKEADAWMTTKIEDFGVRQFLLKNLARDPKGPHEYRWKFNFDVLNRDYENILAAVDADYAMQVPTLFVRGGNSDYVKDEHFEDMQIMFPNAQLDTVEGAGHWLHAEKPVLFYEKVLSFLLAD